ncbi:MAG: methyltransferase domain-containing protein [Desulfobacterales bacterium]|jgi:ubiquinone/menaquinone biosynthesis C-methylase UbiE
MTQHSGSKPTGAGKSSFGLIDTATFFLELDLKKGITFLDVACGWGTYSLAVAEMIGNSGQVYAVDLWEEGIVNLREEAASKEIQNIKAFVSDVAQHIPVEDDCVDVCLMATVLHDLVADRVDQPALKEIVRVMKKEGTLAIVEFLKKEGPPGPPKPVRLSPEEVDQMLAVHGFQQKRCAEIGPDNYLQIFTKTE